MPTPDVKVRLSAEGVAEVVAALRKVQGEAAVAARATAGSYTTLNQVLASTSRLLGAVGVAVGVAQILAYGRQVVQATDSLAKMGERAGTTARNVSALAAAAEVGDVEIGTLEKALGAVAERIEDLRGGSRQASTLFAQLGLSVKSFPTDDTVENFLVIARALSALGDGGEKTGLAMKVFGDSIGKDLIPFMREAADKGLGRMYDEARAVGLLLDDELGPTIDDLNDSTTRLEQSVRGAAIQFAAGFTPELVETMKGVSSATADAANDFRDLGEALGLIVRVASGIVGVIIEPFRTLGQMLRATVDTIAASMDLVRQGAFREAGLVWDMYTVLIAKIKRESNRRMGSAFQRVNPFFTPDDSATAGTARTGRGGAGRSWGILPRTTQSAADKAAAAAAAREIERAKAEILKAEDEIAEAQGRHHEVRMRQIAQQAENLKANLIALDVPQAQATASAQEYVDALTAVESFNQRELEFQRRKAAFDLLAKQLADDRTDGLITEAEYHEKIAALEAERMPRLRELVVELQAAAIATRDNTLVAKVNEYAASLRTSVVQTGEASTEMRDSLQSAFESWAINGIRSVRTLTDAVVSAARAMTEALASVFIRRGAEAFFDWLFPTPVKAASGGLVVGPGTGTSDSIPAFLSSGEFVVRAAAVQRNRELLEAINTGTRVALSRPSGVPMLPARTYANGGLVAPAPRAATADVGGTIRLQVPEGLDAQWVDTPAGRKALLRFVVEHRRSINRGLGNG